MSTTSQKVTINITQEDVSHKESGIYETENTQEGKYYNVNTRQFRNYVKKHCKGRPSQQEQIELLDLCIDRDWEYALHDYYYGVEDYEENQYYNHLVYKALPQVKFQDEGDNIIDFIYGLSSELGHDFFEKEIDANYIIGSPGYYLLGELDNFYDENIEYYGDVIDCDSFKTLTDIRNKLQELDLEQQELEKEHRDSNNNLPLGVTENDLCKKYCCDDANGGYCEGLDIDEYSNTEFCDYKCDTCITYVTEHYRSGCDVKDCKTCADMVTVVEDLDYYDDECEHCETSLLFVKKHNIATCRVKDCNVCKTCRAFLNLHDGKCDVDDECELCNTQRYYNRDIRCSDLGSMISL